MPSRGPALAPPPAGAPVGAAVGAPAGAPAEGGRPGRSRYLDTLRAAAIVRVYLLHVLWLGWLPAAFPAMWVMFAIGGYLTAVSLDRGRPLRVVRSRLRRLLPPLWALALVAVPLMVARGWRVDPVELAWWVVPLVNPPASDWGGPFAIALWYLRAYLWLLLLSPVLWWAFRRWPTALLLALPTAAVLCYSPLAAVPQNPVGDVVWSTVSYGTCWLLGFARHTGLLDRVPVARYAAVTVATAAAGMLWTAAHPRGDRLADLLWGTAFVLVLMRLRPSLAGLDRARWLAGAVTAINARAVTIYIWHVPATFAVSVVLPAAGVKAGMGTTLAATTLVLVGIVVAVGWVEDLAARRPPTLLPPTAPPPGRSGSRTVRRRGLGGVVARP